jgi:hypothetical protein
LWAFSTQVATCHPSGAQSFEVTPRFFGNFVSPGLMIAILDENEKENHDTRFAVSV